MTPDILFLMILLGVTVALFASDRVRLDLVALLVILALLLSGILGPRDALAGFGDPVVILIAGLFIVGEGLSRTGIAHWLGERLNRSAGGGEVHLMVMLMLVVALLSAFMSSTGAVAIFIPVTFSVANRAGVAPRRLLMPMAFAALIGGMLTLIGTPPNLVVSEELQRHGLEPFGFFAFSPIGLVVLAVGMAYLVLIGRSLLGGATGDDLDDDDETTLPRLVTDFDLDDHFVLLQVRRNSPLIGRSLAASGLRRRYRLMILGREHLGHFGRAMVYGVGPSTVLRAGDVLFTFRENADDAARHRLEVICEEQGLTLSEWTDGRAESLINEIGLVEVVLAPRSRLIGHTLRDLSFRQRYGLNVLGLRRGTEPLKGDLADQKLQFGDSLLVVGPYEQFPLLRRETRDVMVMRLPREMRDVAPAHRRAPIALVIVAGMLLLMTLKIVPAVTAVLLAAVAMVISRCLDMKQAYHALNWQSLVLIAGMLPLATALQQTGAIQLIVDRMVGDLGSMGPLAMMAGLFLLTALFSQFISNTATTVLVAPIAYGVAVAMGLDPHAFLMTVAIAASAAFVTPVASPVNTLVLGPGDYRFNDFVKVGLPLTLLALGITLLVVPLLYPFS